MDSIPKFLVSVITIIIGVLFCISFVISSIVVHSARTYHGAIIEEIEASNFDEVTVQKCIENAEKDNYSLTIENVSTVPGENRNLYKVTLGYNLAAPIFGKTHSGTIIGYALSGIHIVEPSIEIPENPVTGDVFIYNDYEYRYNMYFVNYGTWYERDEQNGWGARVLNDSKTSYNRPLSMIGDTPVVCLDNTYFNCKNLEQAPEIPETIVYMRYTYQNCESLSDDNINIPNSVKTLASAFDGCISENFVVAPQIPNSVTDMTHTFTDCVNLEKPPVIPPSVKLLSATFYGCISMTEMPDLSAAYNLEEMNSTFVGCVSLPDNLFYFAIPSTVTSGYKMFMDCVQLEIAPEIPENLTYITSIFENCTSLTGTVYVHSDPSETYCADAFKGTVEPIVIDGRCSEATKEFLRFTATNGNVSLPSVPEEEGAA